MQTEYTFFVSPGGDDRWSGTLPEANADRTAGPLATPAHGAASPRRLEIPSAGKRPAVFT